VSLPTRHRRLHRTGWIPVLVLLMVLAPALGAWHRIAHGGAPASGVQASEADASGGGFGHAAGSLDCAAFDAALGGNGPPASFPALALPAVAPDAPSEHPPAAPALALGWRLPARGPPQA
jgi:hypothetical protein